MPNKLSARLQKIVANLPLQPRMRVLEIGCGPGAAASEIAKRLGIGHIVAIDRSARAIKQAVQASATEIAAGALSFRQSAIEEFSLEPGEDLFDLAFAIRVGAFDGRHPELEQQALAQVTKALKLTGKFFIDEGDVLIEVSLK